jgi:hypothetical protein
MLKGQWATTNHFTAATSMQTQNQAPPSTTAVRFATTTSRSSTQPTNPAEWWTEVSKRWGTSDWLLRYRDSGTGPGHDKSNDNNSNALKQHLGMLTQNTLQLATTSHEPGDPHASAPHSSHFHHSTYHPSLAPRDLLPRSLFPHSKLHKDLAQGPIHLRHAKSTSSRMKTVIPRPATTASYVWNPVTILTATAATAANGASRRTPLAIAPNPMPFATQRTATSQSLTQTTANAAPRMLTTPLSFYSRPPLPPHRITHTLPTSQMRTTHVENESLGRASCYDHGLVNCYLCIPLLPL